MALPSSNLLVRIVIFWQIIGYTLNVQACCVLKLGGFVGICFDWSTRNPGSGGLRVTMVNLVRGKFLWFYREFDRRKIVLKGIM